MDQILLVEDSPEVIKLVESTFCREPLHMSVATTLVEAGTLIAKNQFSLIIFDIMLPDGDGLEFFRSLENQNQLPHTPVIFLTGKDGIEHKVAAFSSGAQDFIAKPFHPLELKARVQSRLAAKKQTQNLVSDEFKLGNIVLEVSSQCAYQLDHGHRQDFNLTPIEFKLLFYFARHPDEPLSRDSLIRAAWGEGIHILDRTVDTHVSKLRKKINTSNYQIKSVHGVGYSIHQDSLKKAV